MRRIGLWLASTAAVVALLFGYHTSTSGVPTTASAQTPITSGPTTTAGQATSPTSSSTSGTSTAGPSSKQSAASSTKTYTGSTAPTRYGPIQVAVEVKSGSVTQVSVLQYPSSDPRDQQINSYALPILVDETVQAQSAQVQMVGGATYTSEGYLTSLQSALDQAGL
jgi:uncharacterized protein with FMN-binding domain